MSLENTRRGLGSGFHRAAGNKSPDRGITTIAAEKGYEVVEVCRETVSGRADEADRHGLKRAEELAVTRKVKKVLVHEISRLARKNSIVHKFVETLEEHGVSLYWHAQGFETLLASGKRNPAASMMLALLAEIARSETETLRERIMSGLREARRNPRELLFEWSRRVGGNPSGENEVLPVAGCD
jgi:DNA invertase Pin-like site-specific DNA recombinase